jgi:hypothetical protein
MHWLHVILGATAFVATPVVAGVIAPGLMTDLAGEGLAVRHRHFVFDETFPIEHQGIQYVVHLRDADLHELPITTQVELRGSVVPAPSDEHVGQALAYALRKTHLPVLSYDLQRSGEDVVIRATLPAGVMASLSPQYQELLAKYEA